MNILIACTCAILISFGLTYLLRKFISPKLGLIDVPSDGRRMHAEPTPIGGGIAIFLAFAVGMLVEFEHLTHFIPYLIGGAIILVCGIFDDRYSVKPIIKIAAQAAAGIVLCVCDLTVEHLSFFGKTLGMGIFSYPLTVLWVIAVTNAFNLIDGLDGLCTGLSIIAAGGIGLIALIGVSSEAFACAMVFMCACIGFLPHNRFKAKIFLGDAGSMLIGFVLAALCMEITYGDASTVAFPSLMPIALIGIPVFDTAYAIVRRIYNKTNVFCGDKKHVHHVLSARYSHSNAVVLMYLGAIVCDGIALIMTGGITGEIVGYCLFFAALAYGVVRFGIALMHKNPAEDMAKAADSATEADGNREAGETDVSGAENDVEEKKAEEAAQNGNNSETAEEQDGGKDSSEDGEQ